MARVEITFAGSSAGAVGAARQVAAALGGVDARNPDELARVLDWIAGKPSLHALLQLGYVLEESGGELRLHMDGEEPA